MVIASFDPPKKSLNIYLNFLIFLIFLVHA